MGFSSVLGMGGVCGHEKLQFCILYPEGDVLEHDLLFYVC